MFSFVEIAEMHRKTKHKALVDNCIVRKCNTDLSFRRMYGILPSSQCEFKKGFNGVVSRIGKEIMCYTTKNNLWIVSEQRVYDSATLINIMLIAYVISQHCGSEYAEIEAIGFWQKKRGTTYLLPVEAISPITINIVNYSYIGYENNNGSWKDSCGTSEDILHEVVEFYRPRRGYKERFVNYKHNSGEKVQIAKFEKNANNYLATYDSNSLLSDSMVFGGYDSERIAINYISDIHIEHHIDKEKPVKPQIQRIAKRLANSQTGKIVLFGGDVAKDREICSMFFREYLYYAKRLKEDKAEFYVVLGNHELADFDRVDDARVFYNELFSDLGIHFLSNNHIEGDNVIVFGGTGFAKYNPAFNALNSLNAATLTREEEKIETDKFEASYCCALEKAVKERRPLVVLSHYPTKDCIENDRCDSHAIYFTGHTHKNFCENSEQRNIYSDNQIGYDKGDIVFKTAIIGTVENPFSGYEDGCYQITIDQYTDFYHYCGEYISGATTIKNILIYGGKLYMIKSHEFYGFFVQKGYQKISICVGGRIRKLPNVKSIKHLMNNFDAMVCAYMKRMAPYRRAQEQISQEVQALGLSGKIHGCIIDVDFYNHIMLNPTDGSVTYYYSPTFGEIKRYDSFYELLKNVQNHSLLESQRDKSLKLCSTTSSEDHMLTMDMPVRSIGLIETETVDIKDGIYGLSRKLNQIQRLFTSRILRDWNEEIIK